MSYDGGMTPLSNAARQVIEGGHLGHLVTLNSDGSPQVSLVWVGLEDGEVVAGHLGSWRKVQNVRRDPRVALSIETGQRASGGLDEYLVVYGTARITEGGAPQLLQRLARTYLGPNVRFPPIDDPPPGYITRIAVDRVTGHGNWDP
jgi:PPOX class probable F420-dependent enzyme